MSKIIHINGFPGVGKLTIGRHLSGLIGAKLLDNHTIYNVAFALTEFKSIEFYETVRNIREVAFKRVLDLPKSVPVIVTNALKEGVNWNEENWDAVIELAQKRQVPLYVVVLSCSPEENAIRIQSEDREILRKLRDPSELKNNFWGLPLIERGGNHLYHLDVTNLSATVAALQIANWLADNPM